MNPITTELNRRFEAIKFDAQDFGFWMAVHDYGAFINDQPTLSGLIEKSRADYYEARAAFFERRDKYMELYDHSNDCSKQHAVNEKEIGRMDNLLGFEMGKMEAMNLYCHSIYPDIIRMAIYEIGHKHENNKYFEGKLDDSKHHREWQHTMATDAMKFEKELNEIRVRRISKNNPLLELGQTIYNDVRFVQRELLNLLSNPTPEPEPVKQPESAPEEGTVTEAEPKLTIIIAGDILLAFSKADAWERVRMEFFGDGCHTEVYIAEEKVGRFHFDQLGFQKGSTPQSKPVLSWNMLRSMAMVKEYPSNTPKAQSVKKDLRLRLKVLFPHLIGEPIDLDRDKKVYRSRITLVDKQDERMSYQEAGMPGTNRQFLRPISER